MLKILDNDFKLCSYSFCCLLNRMNVTIQGSGHHQQQHQQQQQHQIIQSTNNNNHISGSSQMMVPVFPPHKNSQPYSPSR